MMFFTDAEDRQQAELMSELSSAEAPPRGLQISSGGRSFEEQRRIREKWERRKNPDGILFPGQEKHDA